MKHLIRAVIAYLFCCLFFRCDGQQDSVTAAKARAYGDSLVKSMMAADTASLPAGKSATIFLNGQGDKEIIASYNQFALMQYKRAFSWQYYSSIIIFVIVIGVVLMGLYMAYRQFRFAQKIILAELAKKQAANKEDKPLDLSMMDTDLELSGKGIKINTAVIGLIILSLSLGFFFLYLKYVYQIVLVKPL